MHTSRIIWGALWSFSVYQVVFADWQYKTRPDLSPPKLNITIAATDSVSPGYIFVAPYSWLSWDAPIAHGPLQPAPYIFTSAGELVWSGFGAVSGWSGNFQAARYQGQDVLFAFEGSRNALHGHSHGHAKILDGRYETIKEVRLGNHELLDLHEFQILDERTAVGEAYHPIPLDLTKYGLERESQWIVDARFQEVDIKTGATLFEWRSLDHVTPEETFIPISSLKLGTGHNSSDANHAIDYFHINSVDRDSEHNYLISARHTSTIYKINGTSGEIIWRLGGIYSNFSLGKGVEFALQHHARFISKSKDGQSEIISLFDNSEHRPGSGDKLFSSGKIVSVNTTTWTATLLKVFPAPDNIFAFSQGNTQILDNDNAFVNWGSAGAITEFSPNGTVMFHAYLESGELWENGDVQNYRGFKFNWTGVPSETPAVRAFQHSHSTVIYVSWNGDTETESWKFYGVNKDGKKIFLGKEKRKGFETSFDVGHHNNWVGFFAEAADIHGSSLVRTEVVKPETYVSPYFSDVEDSAYHHQAILSITDESD